MTVHLNLDIMAACYVLASLGFLCGVAALVYGIHVAVVFQRFNDGIKDWANALDVSTKDAIDRSARQILRELDQKISEANEEDSVEPLNIEENVKDC